MKRQRLTEDNLVELLDAVDSISGSSDRAETAISVIEYVGNRGDSIRRSDRLKDAVMNTVDAMPSSSDREDALRAVIRVFG